VVWIWQTSCGLRRVRETTSISGGVGFFFLFDMMVVNMFIIYLAEYKKRSQKLVSHLEFRVKLCEALLQSWELQGHPTRPWSRNYCYPIFMELWKPCIVCNSLGMFLVTRSKTHCTRCDHKYMCFKKGCYK
jgi:hypothetical protein